MSEWADANRKLSPGASAEPGDFRTDRAEYQRGIMDAYTDPAVKEVAVKSSAQVGKTTVVENIIGFHIHHDPAPLMIVQPNHEPMGKAFSKERIAPMIEDTPVLKERVSRSKSRDSDNTLLHKGFRGGHLTIAGANSGASLRSRPIRVILYDEVDAYQPIADGDQITLGNARTTTFWNSKKGYFSTPVNEDGRISQLYEESDQRKFYIPCPGCGESFVMEFQHLKWAEGTPSIAADGSKLRRSKDAWVECPHCDGRIEDVARWRAVRRGEWRATAEFHGRAGFWLWAAMSPWVTAKQIADAWLGALDKPEQQKAVKNTMLGLGWKVSGARPNWEWLYERQVPKRKKLPAWVMFITAGIDVQKDRFEVQYVGWGRNKASWLADYVVLPADTSLQTEYEVLDSVLEMEFEHEAGLSLPVAVTGIDSGYSTQSVYAWARKHHQSKVMALKGYDTGVALLGLPKAIDINTLRKRAARGVHVWPFNASMAKAELYRWLNLERAPVDEPPPGYCFFSGQAEEFFKQLTAEEFTTKLFKGFLKGEWVKIRTRNEVLDTRNLARIAAEKFGLSRFTEDAWDAMEEALRPELLATPSFLTPMDVLSNVEDPYLG